MDWVYDQAHGDTSESVQIMEFARDAGLDTNGGFALLYVCEGAGLVRSTSALGDPCVTLTAAGIADVHARRQRREDPAQRAAAARTGLLRWSYRQHLAKVHLPYTEQFAESAEAQFEGTRFTKGAYGEIDYAAKDLANKQLIEGAVVEEYAGPVTAEITPAGIECVVDFGGNVPDYLRDQRSQGPSMNVNGPVVYGDVHGAQLAWGNQTVTQNQQQTQQIAPGFEAIAQAVADTLRQLPAFGLPEEDQQDAEAVANEVLVEVTRSKPDRGKIRRALAALRGFLMPVASGAVAGAEEGARELAHKAIEQIGSSF